MPETVGVAAALGPSVGPDELLANEAHQLAWHGWPTLERGQLGHIAMAELLADDRCPLDRPAFAIAQSVEPRREKGRDGGRDRDRLEIADDERAVAIARDQAVVGEHLDDLLDIERVAVGGGRDPASRERADAGALEEVLHKALSVRSGQGFEEERGR